MDNRFSVFNSNIDTRRVNDAYLKITKKTSKLVSVWRNFIEQEGLRKKYIIMLDWQVSLTNSLKYWLSMDTNISTGDLILARINLGMLVETWLRIFFTIYSYDYQNDDFIIIKNRIEKIKDRKKKRIEIKDLTFNNLITFFISKIDPELFYQCCPAPEGFFELIGKEGTTEFFQYKEDEAKSYDCFKKWLDKIRDTRNSVHSFTYREIGTYNDFIEDIVKYSSFLDIIMQQLPSGVSEDGELLYQ